MDANYVQLPLFQEEVRRRYTVTSLEIIFLWRYWNGLGEVFEIYTVQRS